MSNIVTFKMRKKRNRQAYIIEYNSDSTLNQQGGIGVKILSFYSDFMKTKLRDTFYIHDRLLGYKLSFYQNDTFTIDSVVYTQYVQARINLRNALLKLGYEFDILTISKYTLKLKLTKYNGRVIV